VGTRRIRGIGDQPQITVEGHVVHGSHDTPAGRVAPGRPGRGRR